MSLSSCSDCFSDLLCGEASSSIISSFSPEYSSNFDSQPAESISGMLEDERDVAGISSCRAVDQPIDASVRAEFVAWILKVQRYYGFQPLTAYLSVNYFDRFVCCHQLPKMSGWPLQLLSVACLSLAAKMEERLVPCLLDLQVEDPKFSFEARTIQRMELLVLSVLDWRLRSISPFCYLPFFALKIDPSGTYTDFLTTRAKEIIFSTFEETSFLGCRPSCIAAAAILCAANDLPKFSLITAQHAESWCDGLHKDEITSCQQLIRQDVFKIRPKKQPKVFPDLRVTNRASIGSTSSLLSSNERLVEFAVGGICNACADPTNAAVVIQCDGIPLVIQCLSSPVRNTVNYAIGSLYYLCSSAKAEDEILKPEVVDAMKRFTAAGASFSNPARAFLDRYVTSLNEK